MIAALLVAAGVAAAAATEAVDRHWEAARGFAERGMRRHAIAEANVVLRLQPDHAGARALLASAGAAARGPQPAVAAPDASGTAPAIAPPSLAQAARTAYRESRVEEARRLAREAIAAGADAESAGTILRALDEETYQPSPLGVNDVLHDLFGKALVLYRQEAWEGAAAAFQQALATSPTHDQSRTFFNRSRGRAEDAKFTRSLDEARAAAAAGRDAEARAALKNVLAIRPDHAEAQAMLESLGAGPQAEERRRRAKDHFNLGVAAYEQGRWHEAVRQWELVTGLDPGDEEAKRLLRKARGKASAAKRDAAKRIPAMHDDALRLYQQGKFDDARKLYQAILDLDPADAKAKRSLELIDPPAAPPR